ncbi:hypothetical protein RFI_22719 [Reticulomyxa filosa]|uniref:Uncharacterized protein n=1 Tax=Reticulomyxa filosa TaxID=46433 RepID=X6MKV8_RETFI|nr:hypothetical protein RFI_22719 [Reticulomyxa filosa]|eukprot:ETO14648.1 hypothetical protein RFI_22719 [Reticulomyxa filosa]
MWTWCKNKNLSFGNIFQYNGHIRTVIELFCEQTPTYCVCLSHVCKAFRNSFELAGQIRNENYVRMGNFKHKHSKMIKTMKQEMEKYLKGGEIDKSFLRVIENSNEKMNPDLDICNNNTSEEVKEPDLSSCNSINQKTMKHDLNISNNSINLNSKIQNEISLYNEKDEIIQRQ